MSLEYRPIKSHAEYFAAEELQNVVWGSEREIVPTAMLLTAHKNGGVVLGAFDQQRMVGLAFGFLGFTGGQKLKHCSHLLAVDPMYRDQQIGRKLKLLQREVVLAQGIDLMTWTFDPLESRNALLNLHHLGATCNTYLPNLYGAMNDELNMGLPSDRFQVDWQLGSQRVLGCIATRVAGLGLKECQDRGAVLINPAPAEDPLSPATEVRPIVGKQVLIRIPSAFQSLKASRPEMGLAWRLHLRAICEAAFAAGYTATDIIRDGNHTYYLLEQHWSAP